MCKVYKPKMAPRSGSLGVSKHIGAIREVDGRREDEELMAGQREERQGMVWEKG